MSGDARIRRISLVVPCYNEAESIDAFYRRAAALATSLPERELELLFVNDGSTDATAAKLDALASADPRVRVLHLAQNRGHQIAITAGLDYASGDLIVTLDADLQDPPEVVPEMLAAIEAGHDVVHAQRRRRAGEGWFKLATARLFYSLMRRISGVAIIPDCGDYRAFTRPVLEAVRGFRTPHRFLRGTFVEVGFRQAIVPYNRDARHAGTTKYPLRRMIGLAVDGTLGFSPAPIRSLTWLAVGLWTLSLGYLAKALYERFVLQITVPGWTSLIVMLIFFTGLILFCMAVIGAYIGRIFQQAQQAPLYWLRDVRNVDLDAASTRAGSLREVQLSRRILEARDGR
jgi:dolichol-phosphate mannosyltransferase